MVRQRYLGVPERIISNLDFEFLMIDDRHIKAHQHVVGTRGESHGMRYTNGNLAQNYFVLHVVDFIIGYTLIY